MSEAKSFLRREFERILGRSVSDRTWQRIRHERLGIEDESDMPRYIYDVRIYAYLRKQRTKNVTYAQVVDYQNLIHHFPVSRSCSGAELYAAIAALVDNKGNTPAPSTIYAWGHELGLPIYKHRTYSSFEVWRWIAFLIGKARYRVDVSVFNQIA